MDSLSMQADMYSSPEYKKEMEKQAQERERLSYKRYVRAYSLLHCFHISMTFDAKGAYTKRKQKEWEDLQRKAEQILEGEG